MKRAPLVALSLALATGASAGQVTINSGNDIDAGPNSVLGSNTPGWLPEPGPGLMLGAGVALLALLEPRRRRRER